MNDFQKGMFKMFKMITSAYWGKEMYFLQDNNIVYSRYSSRYMSLDKAFYEFIYIMNGGNEYD